MVRKTKNDHTRKDDILIIEVNKMLYHIINTDVKYWIEEQQRIIDGDYKDKL